MNLSVVIPSKTASNLKTCISAIRHREPGVRIIVVDDGICAIDRIQLSFVENEGIAELDPMHIEWVEGIAPFIFARNCNLGIDAAGDDDVVLLNDDAVLFTDHGFSEMQRVADAHPEFGVVGATTNITGQVLQQPSNVGLRVVPHFAFVCVLIPRLTIKRIGKLDERYCLDYGVEDRDYCEAVNRAGMKCGVFDFCYVDHASLRSTYRGDPYASRSYTRNAELFHQKWGVPA